MARKGVPRDPHGEYLATRDRYVRCHVDGCYRKTRRCSRYCIKHYERSSKFGGPTVPALTWRRDVEPLYGRWIDAGLTRLKDHPATLAGIKLAETVIAWEMPPGTIRYRSDRATGALTLLLRQYEVKPIDILRRVAMLNVYLQDRPTVIRGPRPERFAYSRAVLGLLPWRKGFKMHQVGALGHEGLGQLVQTQLYGWAVKFIARLHTDAAERDNLQQQAQSY